MENEKISDWQEGVGRFLNSDADRVKLHRLSQGRYLLVHREAGAEKVTLEVTGGRQLDRNFPWGEAQLQGIFAAGLRQQRASENFRRTWTLDGFSREGVRVTQELQDVLFDGEEGRVTCFTQTDFQPRAKGVEDAMDHLARVRTWQARTGLYRLLLEARLLVPVDEGGPGERTRFRPVDEMGGFPVVCAFTDYERLDALFPLGTKVLALPGDVLFPELLAARIGALRLNPGSTPHGELYSNEISTMVEGLQRLRGMH